MFSRIILGAPILLASAYKLDLQDIAQTCDASYERYIHDESNEISEYEGTGHEF